MQAIKITEVKKIELNFDPVLLRVYNNEIYCVNYHAQNIVVLNSQGDMIRQIGRKGNGPGEFLNIIDLSVDANGISVIDGSSKSITEFTLAGTVKKIYKNKGDFFRAIKLADSKYLVKTASFTKNNEERFEILDNETGQKTTFRASSMYSTPNQELQDLLIQNMNRDGCMFRNGNDKIFRVSLRSGEFLAFEEKTGKLIYGRKTIDETNLSKDIPTSTASNGNVKTVQLSLQNTRVINVSATANKKYLFVLSNAPSPNIRDKYPHIASEQIVDVYNVEKGDYMFSFQMPLHNNKGASDIHIAQEKLYAIHENEIVQYNIQIP